MNNETELFNGGNVIVTDLRFIVGSQTYAMRAITSVKGIEITPSIFGRLFNQKSIFGRLFNQKSTFAVVLFTAGGEVRAIKSTDSNFIGDVLEALNKAIVVRR